MTATHRVFRKRVFSPFPHNADWLEGIDLEDASDLPKHCSVHYSWGYCLWCSAQLWCRAESVQAHQSISPPWSCTYRAAPI